MPGWHCFCKRIVMSTIFPVPRDPAHDSEHPLARAFATFRLRLPRQGAAAVQHSSEVCGGESSSGHSSEPVAQSAAGGARL